VIERARLTVIVLTRDEELNLGACLGSLRGWVENIVVVDTGSTDRTIEIAQQHGVEVVDHPFESHRQQWEWAVPNVAGESEWVLGLDADQIVSEMLRRSIVELFADSARLHRHSGFYVNRRQIFRGRWIRYGGYYPKYLLKLFRRSDVRFDPADLMDHHFHVTGATARLRGDLHERNHKEDDISFWLMKHVRYAELVAAEELLRERGATAVTAPALTGHPDQRSAWLKRRWYTLPRYWRPTLYFLYRYFLRFGFMDGKEGFVFHVLQAFWFRLVVDVNLEELERVRERRSA
jgi:glycosyltransferase involved in cell wall biosynthesis